jgi:hypothetical protein
VSPLELIKLTALMERTSGSPEVKIGLIDGPVLAQHADLATENIREIRGENRAACAQANSLACLHGTFIAGILSGRRTSAAPAICPNCTLLIRTIFAETTSGHEQMPSATAGMTDKQTLHAVLSQRENRYLIRQLCWVLTIQGLDTYLLLARDPVDIDLLLEAIRTDPSPNDIDVVIGMRGPIAPPTMCNGLMVPIVLFGQIYSFDRHTLIDNIPKAEKTTKAQFGPAAEELFNRIMQLTDNAGTTDEHRALNYLAMRYPAIYVRAAEAFAQDFSLTAVEARPSPLSSTRRIVDVIFAYTNRNTDFTEKFCVRVDVTEEFPFLVTKMSPYFDRSL